MNLETTPGGTEGRGDRQTESNSKDKEYQTDAIRRHLPELAEMNELIESLEPGPIRAALGSLLEELAATVDFYHHVLSGQASCRASYRTHLTYLCLVSDVLRREWGISVQEPSENPEAMKVLYSLAPAGTDPRPILEAIAIVAQELPEPTRGEFLKRQRYAVGPRGRSMMRKLGFGLHCNALYQYAIGLMKMRLRAAMDELDIEENLDPLEEPEGKRTNE